MNRRRQCAKCPWKTSTNRHDIPNGYDVEKHRALQCTIADPGDMRGIGRGLRVMACHESKPGKESPCVGWLAHQLGPGNNIALRMAVIQGRIKPGITVGPQHRRFEDTLPEDP